jgi:hypothetical protein
LCDGSEINRITYARLFSKVGTTFGAGDGLNTFNLPNLINRMPRGTGSLINEGEIQEDGTSTKGLSVNTTIATKTGLTTNTTGGHTHNYATAQDKNGAPTSSGGADPNGYHFWRQNFAGGFTENYVATNNAGSHSHSVADHTHGATTTLTSTLTETRVKALGLKWWIYY